MSWQEERGKVLIVQINLTRVPSIAHAHADGGLTRLYVCVASIAQV
jgi:hypothetical protein